MTFRAFHAGLCAASLCPGILFGISPVEGMQLTRPSEGDPLSQNLFQAANFSDLFSIDAVAEELDASLEGILALQGLEFYANIRSAPLRNNRVCIRDSGNPSAPCGSRNTTTPSLALRAEDGALAHESGALRADDGALATESATVRTDLYEISDDPGVLRTEAGVLANDKTEVRTESGFLETELRAIDKASTETVITPTDQSSPRTSSNSSLGAGGESLLSLNEEPIQTAEEIREEEEARQERARQRQESKAERLEETERNRTADMIANGALAGLVVVTIVSAVMYDLRGRIAAALSGKSASHQPYQAPINQPPQPPLRR